MPKMIFLNLPVTDLPRAIKLYEAIGATKNPQFSNDEGACMVFSDAIHVMLLTHDKFRQFTPKPIADARTTSAVLMSLSADSKADVDKIIERAVAAGASPDPSPVDDYDFMYGRSFEDQDGHLWGVMWLDINAMPPASAGA